MALLKPLWGENHLLIEPFEFKPRGSVNLFDDFADW